MNRFTFLKSCFAASLLLAPSLFAEEAPAERLIGTIDRVFDALSESESTYEAKRNQVHGILDEQFNFDAMVKGALGRNRKALSESEMEQVTSLVTDLLISAYLREFNDKARPEVSYKKQVELTKNKIEIPSTITLDGNEVNLTYRLARLQSGWQVYDLIIEGVSMVRNYREQFDQHFQTKGVPELIELITNKIEEF